MRMSFPNGETAAAYVTKNRKKLYVGVVHITRVKVRRESTTVQILREVEL